MDELKKKLCKNKGPKVQATLPDYVKFHDDKVAILPPPHHPVQPLTCNAQIWPSSACVGIQDWELFPRMQLQRMVDQS